MDFGEWCGAFWVEDSDLEPDTSGFFYKLLEVEKDARSLSYEYRQLRSFPVVRLSICTCSFVVGEGFVEKCLEVLYSFTYIMKILQLLLHQSVVLHVREINVPSGTSRESMESSSWIFIPTIIVGKQCTLRSEPRFTIL